MWTETIKKAYQGRRGHREDRLRATKNNVKTSMQKLKEMARWNAQARNKTTIKHTYMYSPLILADLISALFTINKNAFI